MVALNSLLLACVLSGAGDVVLLDFSAAYCPPCREMAPTIDRLAREGYPIQKIDIQQQEQLARSYRVTGIPCLVMLKDGQEITRVSGLRHYSDIVEMFRKAGYSPGETRPTRDFPADDGGGRRREPPPSASFPIAGESEGDASPFSLPEDELPGDRVRPASLAVRDMSRGAGGAMSPQERALQATVRLKVEDERGHSFGTGTIIDVHGEEALVLTCGHIFRESGGRGKIYVELCAGEGGRPLLGHLIDFDADKRDIALVSIQPGVKIVPARVAPPEFQARQDAAVFSVGCDHGGAPRLLTSRLTAIDKYLGPPNFVVAGKPVEGRSGGGLFTADGRVIGVCNAADHQDNEGIYAALATVQWHLDRNGLRRIYEQSSAGLAGNRPPDPRSGAFDPPPLSPTNGYAAGPAVVSAAGPPSDPAPNGETELIVIVRNRSGGSRTIVLDRPSPELLNSIEREAGSALPPAAASADRRNAGPPAGNRFP